MQPWNMRCSVPRRWVLPAKEALLGVPFSHASVLWQGTPQGNDAKRRLPEVLDTLRCSGRVGSRSAWLRAQQGSPATSHSQSLCAAGRDLERALDTERLAAEKLRAEKLQLEERMERQVRRWFGASSLSRTAEAL